ncbi:MAG: SDR family NAD(P)-dependent oxidoreductase [Hyphomicrobiaceae bacterium]
MARQTVLVTGVSRGIGQAIAAHLSASGYEVIGLSRTRPEGFAGRHVALDLADPAARQTLADLCAEVRPGRVVANAGIAGASSLLDVADAHLEAVVRVNLTSVVWLMQAAARHMMADGFGRMVVLGSRAALGKRDRIAYSASKAALGGLVRTAALELGQHGITINIVAPGPIETEMFAKLQPAGSPQRDAIVAETAVGRVGQPGEVAAAVDYFLSDAAGFTTGQTLYVCGGLTVGSVG